MHASLQCICLSWITELVNQQMKLCFPNTLPQSDDCSSLRVTIMLFPEGSHESHWEFRETSAATESYPALASDIILKALLRFTRGEESLSQCKQNRIAKKYQRIHLNLFCKCVIWDFSIFFHCNIFRK